MAWNSRERAVQGSKKFLDGLGGRGDLGMGNACFFQSINSNSIIDFENVSQSIPIQLLTSEMLVNQFQFNYQLKKCKTINSHSIIDFQRSGNAIQVNGKLLKN